MISRLTAVAAAFAILATASLAVAAGSRQVVSEATAAAKAPVRVVQLERVVVIGKRLPQAVR